MNFDPQMNNETYFKYRNCKPGQSEPATFAEQVINSLCIAMDLSWSEAFGVLVEQSKLLGLMPDHHLCVERALMAMGFQRLTRGEGLTNRTLPAYMERNYSEGEILLVHSGRRSVWSKGFMTAVIPAENGHYQCQGTQVDAGPTVYLWLGKPKLLSCALDFFREEHPSLFAERITPVNFLPTRDHDYYHCYQPNPLARNIGDCVIRAFSAVLSISWEEAVARIGDASAFSSSTVNATPVFTDLLVKEGFVKQKRMQNGRKMLTGKEFCHRLNQTYHNGEKVFAFLGMHHVAAVLPYPDEEGEVHYKITDSWDSSDCKVTSWWLLL